MPRLAGSQRAEIRWCAGFGAAARASSVVTAAGARIAIVFGTRPEVVKLAELARRLEDVAVLVNTGQHWDDAMSGVFLRDLGVGRPDHVLEIGGLSRGEQIGEATAALSRLFADLRPAAAVVQGDTNSALAGALAANAVEVPVVHLEAGLRSFDRRMPEEHNRVVIDHLTEVCLAPTEASAANLRAERDLARADSRHRQHRRRGGASAPPAGRGAGGAPQVIRGRGGPLRARHHPPPGEHRRRGAGRRSGGAGRGAGAGGPAPPTPNGGPGGGPPGSVLSSRA